MIPLAGAQATQSSPEIFPSDADIRMMLADRVDALSGQEDGIGIVVGIVGPQGRRVISYGHLNQGDPRLLNGDTAFEIGSVSKVFTALLLADMIQKGEVALTDPVAKYLPSHKIPEQNGHSITLADLTTHTSALPFMPDDLPAFDDSAAAKNSIAYLYKFLAHFQLPRDPGAEWDYSNIGYWLLGEALASRAGTDYESLLQTHVIAPLNFTNTGITASAKMKTNFAVGHNAILQPSPSFSAVPPYETMAAAGGIASTANDMLTFLSVCMGYERPPLAASMTAMLSTRRAIDDASEQALGWVVMGKADDQLVTHDGFTWGYASYLAWDPKRRVGVVVLSNQLSSVSDIGHHLLRPNVPLERQTFAKHTEIALDAAVLDAYAGQYEVQDEGVFNITRDHDFLRIQLPTGWGLPKLRLRPESRRVFFVAELPVRVEFQMDGDGHVNGLLVYPPRGQHALQANRMRSDR